MALFKIGRHRFIGRQSCEKAQGISTWLPVVALKGTKWGNEVGTQTHVFRKETSLQGAHFLSQNPSALTLNPVAFQAVYKLPAHTGAIILRSDS